MSDGCSRAKNVGMSKIREIENSIRDGVVIGHQPRDQNWKDMYRGVFINGNFYLYHLVKKSMSFRGDVFNDDMLVLVYSNITQPYEELAPSMVRAKEK